ncbi:hypothetical protein ABIC89_002429 [Variovorax boronicumulans]|uniref:DUF4303 domain-containing protein n=1 Tax=Variovorax boronicumulans TaxID=436515 RepID=UPI00339365D4
MYICEFKRDLATSLVRSCKEVIASLPASICDASIYSFSLYCASGCTSFGVAFSTLEALNKKNENLANSDAQKLINKLSAAEWPFVNYGFELFKDSNDLVDGLYNTLYEGVFEDVVIDPNAKTADLTKISTDCFIESISNAFVKLKSDSDFSSKKFIGDPFFGLQFGDPSPNELRMMENVSELVNSPEWHEEALKAFNGLSRKHIGI